MLFVGDTHWNVVWWENVVLPAIARHRIDLVIQVGDLGLYREQQEFLDVVAACSCPVWFVGGNHEDYKWLHLIVDSTGRDENGMVPIGGSLRYAPRGTVTEIGGSRVLFCGGAHSVNRQAGVEGVDWFPDEDITDADIERCVAHGSVDVMVCHDAPTRWAVPGVGSAPMPVSWLPELAAANDNRQRLSTIFDALEPTLFVHGHYHVGYERSFDAGWGELTVIGLNQDGARNALAVVDFQDGNWTLVATSNDV